MKKIFRVCIALLLCFSLVTPAFALDGIWHNPYGIDDLYDHEPTEIYPLTPIAGEMIYIKSTTWPIEPGQSVWLTYTKNGEPQQDVGAEWKYNDGNNSYWEAAIGPFAQGDVIEYTVYADKDGQNTQSIGPFSFHVVEWESAQSVELGSQEEGLVVLNVTPDQGDSTPKLGLSFPSADVLRFQFSPLGDVAFEAGAADYSIEEDSNIMQFHSEKANPSPSEERSPWNVQERTGDDTIIPTFRYYVNTRMNILPYIYSEAQQCTEDGTPLMRAMMIDFPEDPEAYDLEEQYMFGRSLLVAPVLEEGQTVKEIYLPEGEWIDFFHNALTAGGGTKNYYCDVDSIPVYVRNGSIIPMNLNEDYELGGSIGNDVDNYTNLTFRVYPKGDSSYTLVHSDRSTMTVSASEDFKNSSVSVSIPAAAIPVTTQVFGTEPTGVTVNGQAIQRAATLDEFQAAQTAYYYSSSEKLVYIKTAAGDASEIEIEGIYQAPYEAEHAEQANVAVNTDHEGYYGEGFVDQFASEGCAVTFTVNSDGDTALLDVRYSAGTEAAQRTLLVNGESIVLDLPKTQDWDSWNTVSVPVELVSGQNTITISYQAGNFAGINLDCISLRNQ